MLRARPAVIGFYQPGQRILPDHNCCAWSRGKELATKSDHNDHQPETAQGGWIAPAALTDRSQPRPRGVATGVAAARLIRTIWRSATIHVVAEDILDKAVLDDRCC